MREREAERELDEREGVAEGRPADALDGLRRIGGRLPGLDLGRRLAGRGLLRCRLLRRRLLRGALHCRFLLRRHARESTPTFFERSIACSPTTKGELLRAAEPLDLGLTAERGRPVRLALAPPETDGEPRPC